jgi:RHS repeat-associated protein
MRTQLQLPTHSLVLMPTGATPQEAFAAASSVTMGPPLGLPGLFGNSPHFPGCQDVRPVCDESPGFPSPADWYGSSEATLQRGSGTCSITTPAPGRLVPPSCEVAAISTTSATAGFAWRPAGGALVGPECDGRCPECTAPWSVFNTDVRPRQCWLTTSAGDICSSGTPSLVASVQQELRDRLSGSSALCGDFRDPTARCGGCETLPGGQGTDVKVCVRCSMLPRGEANTCTTYASSPVNVLASATRFAEGGAATGGGVIDQPGGARGPSLAPFLPCTVGCAKPRHSDLMPSGAPRPGAAANGADAPLPGINATKNQPTNQGSVAGDGAANTTISGQPAANGDPVTLADGALVLSSTDLSFPGPHRPLAFTRHYTSRTETRGVLGSNWTHDYEVRVVPLRQQNLPSWVDPYCAGTPHVTTCALLISGGRSRLFILDQLTGLFMPQAGSTATLRKVQPDSADAGVLSTLGWALRHPDGHEQLFDREGYLVRDADRFGKGLTFEYEVTAPGRLFDAVCPRLAEVLSDAGVWVTVDGPTGYTRDSAACALLYGLTGWQDMPGFQPTLPDAGITVVSDSWFPLTSAQLADSALVQARSFVVASQADGYGTPTAFGPAHKRLTRVRDDLGRSLDFTYSPSTGLLTRVTGPGHAAVDFTYASPAQQPAGLRESYLVSVQRTDGTPSTSDVVAAPGRGSLYEYAWQRASEQMPTAANVASAMGAYEAYFKNIYNCGYDVRTPCGRPAFSAVMYVKTEALLEEHRRRLYSQAADNITTVREVGGGVHTRIESETRYERDVFSPGFDTVRFQRWGSEADVSLPSVATPPGADSFSWQTSLPLAAFEYQEADPHVGSGALGELTEAFLPYALRSRYPLEDVPGWVVDDSSKKGMLLPPQSLNPPQTGPFAARLPPLVTGAVQISSDGGIRPACGIDKLPELRTLLPGYRPGLDYYDVQLPADDGSHNPGVRWDMALRRTWLSCETLSVAQTYDVRHNDLATTWEPRGPDGGYDWKALTGRRRHTSANANRICRWAKYVDRDGDTHFTGLNFQGRPLVEAVLVGGAWKVAETLYNADGNVVAQRRTTTAPWTPTSGDTRYWYQEELIAPGSAGTTRPFHWAKRANVVRVEVRPRGGQVQDEVMGTSTLVTSRGRFSAYGYEPFFNQLNVVTRGALDEAGNDVPLEKTSLLFDYQELSAASAAPLILDAQSWGADFPPAAGGAGSILPPEVAALFDVGEVNGDGSSSMVGVPIRVLREGGPGLGQAEESYLSWNLAGLPVEMRGPDGSRRVFEYYSATAPQAGAAAASPAGDMAPQYFGFLARVTAVGGAPPKLTLRQRGTCPELGPWAFLLNGCGDARSDLHNLGLPMDAVDAVLAAKDGEVTAFDYNEVGHVSWVRTASGVRTHVVTDTDGRVRLRGLFPAGATAATFTTEEVYDDFMRVVETRRRDGAAQHLGSTFRTWDGEDRLLSQCDESEALGCAKAIDGFRRWVYTREGHLFRAVELSGAYTEYRRDGRKWVYEEAHVSPDPLDAPWAETVTRDDDGRVLYRVVAGGASALADNTSYDGLGRRLVHTDTQGRVWTSRWTAHDAPSSVAVAGDAAGPTRYVHDGFGRVTEVTKAGRVLAEYLRGPGGVVYGTRAEGLEWSWRSYDATGAVAVEEDAAGNQHAVFDGVVGGQHLAAAVHVRRNGPVTTTVAELDALGLPSWSREEGGGVSRTTTYTRDAKGLLTAVTAPDGHVSQADYDLLGRMVRLRKQRVAGASTFEETRYAYDAAGRLFEETDPAGYVTVQHYTGFGRPRYRSLPASTPQVAEWEYDGLGRKLRHQAGNGQVDMGYRYDGAGRLVEVVRGEPGNQASPLLRKYEYDALGRATKLVRTNLGLDGLLPGEDRTVVVQRSYDDVQLLVAETTAVGRHQARTVTAQWETTPTWKRTVTLPSGRTQAREYTPQGEVWRLHRAGGGTSALTWRDELLTEVAHDTGLTTATTYDELAQPVRWETRQGGQGVLDVTVQRDVVGRIISSTQAVRFRQGGQGQHWRGYEYDVLGRLAAVHEAATLAGPVTHHAQPGQAQAEVQAVGTSVNAARWGYTRDEVVGSVQRIADGLHAPRFEAPLQQQTPFGFDTARLAGYRLRKFDVEGHHLQAAYDAAGRVSSDGRQDYDFDDEGLLAAVVEKGTSTLKEGYLYDATGRLVGRVDGWGTLVEQLVYDGAQAVESWQGGQVAWSATWGPGLDALVSVQTETEEYFALSDGKGSVAAYAKAGEAATQWLEYTPEGRVTVRDEWGGVVCTEAGATGCPLAGGMPFGFHTAWRSAGTGLLYFRNRWYAPHLGQWLSQDALGAVDSHDLYAFNAFDPVNFVDPWGLRAKGAVEPQLDDVAPPPPGWEYVEVTSTSATARVADFGVAASRALAEAKFEARRGGHALALFDVPVEPTPLRPGGQSGLQGQKPPGAAPRPVPGGPRQPLRPHPVLLGLSLGLAGCGLIPQCAENLSGIMTEGARLARAVGERLSGAEKPPPATPTRPPTLEPKTLPEPFDPMSPDSPAAADAPDEAPQPATDGAGALVPPTPRSPIEQLPTVSLIPTHGRTKSNTKQDKLRKDIQRNGIQDPIKYVEQDGKRYVVDGHHRLEAARELKLTTVPAVRVELPYGGYRTESDLTYSDF